MRAICTPLGSVFRSVMAGRLETPDSSLSVTPGGSQGTCVELRIVSGLKHGIVCSDMSLFLLGLSLLDFLKIASYEHISYIFPTRCMYHKSLSVFHFTFVTQGQLCFRQISFGLFERNFENYSTYIDS